MARIHVLDAVTANQIAAGEVVERPASIVKELVENAIDAGATEIEIEIAEGGLSYLRVTDNGNGMEPEDAELAFVRHATSKIRTAEDIFAVASLGFRGEALPSIASVAKVRLQTRPATRETGVFLAIEGGKETERGEIGAPSGTTVEVRDLFYNTPARRKFMKTERTESGRINALVGKMALAEAGITFRLINNGRIVIDTPGNGSLADTFAGIYGAELSEAMLPVEFQGDTATVRGLVGKPSVLKGTRQWQTFIVNRRVVESPLIARALTNAYHSLLPKNGHPVAVLQIETTPEEVDVNVHPQKREIRFLAEQQIFRQVSHAILSALTAAAKPAQVATEIRQRPAAVEKDMRSLLTDEKEQQERRDAWREALRQEAEKRAAERAPVQESAERPEIYTSGTATSGRNAATQPAEYVPPSPQRIAESTAFTDYLAEQRRETTAALFEPATEAPYPVPLGQVADCFIICQMGEELYIIDQHAAHERIRYDRLAVATEGIPSQQLLVPVLLTLAPEEIRVLTEREEDLRELGFVLAQAGPNVIRVDAAPADAEGAEQERMIREIAATLQDSHAPTREQLRHRVLAYAACRGAIKAGHRLNIRQMRELISDLFATSRPFVCPHGRPVIVRFTAKDLANLFERT
ncbi:MAG: DNA mismatch repair endonuclease MutL [Veillonellaceae bacterium]|nr:DNA mismatch repair endonuclease MutL [Veillonellaceae bacterium]